MQDLRVRGLGQKDPLRKEMAAISVFLPGKSHRQRSLGGYSPWGHKESDMAKRLKPHHRVQHERKSLKNVIAI